MQIVYTGSLPRPTIPQLRGVDIERGVPVEVPDDIGVTLLEQSTWQEVEPEKPAKAKTTKTDEKP